MDAETIAGALKGRRCQDGWICRCPAHEDKRASLSVKQAREKVLVHCFAGCDPLAIIGALQSMGLWPERPRQAEMSPADRRAMRREREAFEADLDAAHFWRIAAVEMIEHALVEEKARLFAPTEPEARHWRIAALTEALEGRRVVTVEAGVPVQRFEGGLRDAGDGELVRQYREFRQAHRRQAEKMARYGEIRTRQRVAITNALVNECITVH